MAVDSYMTLSQLQERIRETLCRGFAAPVWITAEIGELKVNARSGHCYLQLVEKGGRNGVPQAQVQAVIWAGQYGMLSSYFRGATGEELAVGMKVLLHVTVTYHELYGLSLRIVDIDPLYTLGDLARQRMQTIAQLREDGVFDLNRELGIPEVPQRIAVVSSPQAAGYQDFMKELGASPYRFDVTLFGAVMQGHGAETSIIGALDAVADRAEERFELFELLSAQFPYCAVPVARYRRIGTRQGPERRGYGRRPFAEDADGGGGLSGRPCGRVRCPSGGTR